MTLSRNTYLLPLLIIVLAMASCKKPEPPEVLYGGFPVEVGQIMIDNCALSGCHDDNSFEQEGRLSLTGWDELFQGSRNGAAVVPYREDQSYLLFFINTDPAKGIVQAPTMPINQPPLADDEVDIIRNWVIAGAPDIHGNIKFADNPQRDKIYVANQGCDQVTVFDRATRVVMRYVDVGQTPGFTESPHMIRVSPDGQYWYVVFLAVNTTIEKYRTSDDTFVGSIEIGSGDWNTLSISPDGKYAFAVAYTSQKVQVADLENMVALPQAIQTPEKPHGSTVNPGFTATYITQQDRSRLYKLSYTNPMSPDALDEICLIPNCAPTGTDLQPHEVAFTPDGSRYLVTCQGTNDVRILQTSNDSLLAVIPTGDYPSEIAFDAATGLAFITCMEDVTTFGSDPNKRGSVAIIDYQSLSLVNHVYTGYQPHGLAVDPDARVVYVAHRNANPTGPAPHHTTDCGGRNGYMGIIDLNTLAPLDFKAELSVDPYSVDIR